MNNLINDHMYLSCDPINGIIYASLKLVCWSPVEVSQKVISEKYGNYNNVKNTLKIN